MRFRVSISLVLVVCALSACGGKATPTAAPIASAGILPTVASATPGATRPVETQAAMPPTVLVTPTPPAPPIPDTGTRVPAVATGARATAAQPTATPAPHTAQPNATAQAPAVTRMTDIPGGSPQQAIGSAQDGLVLLNVRVGKNDGFTRVVFDLAKQDGSAAPLPQTRLWREGETIVIAFGGVRDDLFGQSLGGGAQPVNTGTVQSVYRIPVRDDSSAAYGIAVHGGAKATLSAAASPTRVIVDIADQ